MELFLKYVGLNVFLFLLLGDLGGPSARGEVGGDANSKNRAGSPNSPSSSGGFRQFSSKDWSM